MTQPEPPRTTTALDVRSRIHGAMRDLRRANHEVEWIILGQVDWYDLRRSVARFELDGLITTTPDSVVSYRGARIATVPNAHFLEVVPKVRW